MAQNHPTPLADHARHTWQDCRNEGPAARPLDFPPPQVHRGVRVNALVVHPSTGERDVLSGVIHRESYRRNNNQQAAAASDNNNNVAENAASPTNRALIGRSALHHRSSPPSPEKTSHRTTPPRSNNQILAYFPQRRLQDAIFGSVWACLVLHRHTGPATHDAARAAGLPPNDPAAPIVWEIAGYHVAIKMVEWSRVHQNRGRLLEDPIKEIAAMQLIGVGCVNVLGSLEVLQDNEFCIVLCRMRRASTFR